MITREDFLKIKKGDLVTCEPERAYGFHRITYQALEDCEADKVKMSQLGTWIGGDGYLFLNFRENNDWHVNISQSDINKLRENILIEITCPCCKNVFRVSRDAIKILDELTPENVGYVLQ